MEIRRKKDKKILGLAQQVQYSNKEFQDQLSGYRMPGCSEPEVDATRTLGEEGLCSHLSIKLLV